MTIKLFHTKINKHSIVVYEANNDLIIKRLILRTPFVVKRKHLIQPPIEKRYISRINYTYFKIHKNNYVDDILHTLHFKFPQDDIYLSGGFSKFWNGGYLTSYLLNKETQKRMYWIRGSLNKEF